MGKIEINWSMVATLIVAAIALFFLKKYLVRVKLDPATGKQSSYVGIGESEF